MRLMPPALRRSLVVGSSLDISSIIGRGSEVCRDGRPSSVAPSVKAADVQPPERGGPSLCSASLRSVALGRSLRVETPHPTTQAGAALLGGRD